MQPAAPPPPAASLSIDDVYYALFRHKGKILICALLGVLAGAASYLSIQPVYVSEAKLFVRYVVVEGMSQRPTADDSVTKSPDRGGETIMSSEQQIITSLDLVRQVAQTIGPEKILARLSGGNDLNLATLSISSGLTTYAPSFSSVIDVRFQHPDPTLVQPVLQEVIAQYLKKHMEIHRSPGLVGDFLNQETDQLRARLAQTEDDLRKARTKAGVVSIEEAKKSLSEQTAAIRQQIFAAEAELAERSSIVQEFAAAPATGAAETPAPAGAPAAGAPADAGPPRAQPAIPLAVQDEYRGVCARLEFLRRREQEMLLQYTPENPRVKETEAQIAETQAAKQQLESTYHGLTLPAATSPAAVASQPGRTSSIDTVAEAMHINGLQAKIKALKAQLESVRTDIVNLDQAEGNIQELMRKKQLEETNYLHYAASLEQSRINEALGSGRVSNITQIQTPSPPFVEKTTAFKVPVGLAGGGLGLGLALAFFIEMFWDRSVRRPIDVEKKLKLPLFISLPYFGERRLHRFLPWRRKQKALPAPNGETRADASALAATPSPGDAARALPDYLSALLPFHDTLRDRLIGYFESRDLTHKPKLVAVTGINHGSGVTTTAAGLAKSLSETGDGNVLLVDMSPGNLAARQFSRGKAVCGLEEMLAVRDSAQVQDRLFVVANGTEAGSLAQALPQRFRQLMPKLKASNFDYIIFDMPAVSQISVTPRLAGFMDIVLLVTESEKDSVELVQRATTMLLESKAQVGVVLNKTRNYVPVAIHREELGY